MQIGAVAEALGMTPSAIRYYERRGLIKPVGRVDGRREFDTKSILTLRFLKLAQAAGCTLQESRMLLEIGFGDMREQDDWKAFLRDKQQDLQQRSKEIQDMQQMLAKFEACECPTLSDCMQDARAS